MKVKLVPELREEAPIRDRGTQWRVCFALSAQILLPAAPTTTIAGTKCFGIAAKV